MTVIDVASTNKDTICAAFKMKTGSTLAEHMTRMILIVGGGTGSD
jgi:hypothetical protein